MSPEYVTHGQFSMKSDVYSFGVLILEIISGKKNSSFYQMDGLVNNLVTYVSPKLYLTLLKVKTLIIVLNVYIFYRSGNFGRTNHCMSS